MDVPILISGLLISGIWWAGAYAAYNRRRGMLVAGTILAGLAAIPFTIIAAGGHVAGWLIAIVALLRAPVALLLVGSFLATQHGKRPDRWSP